MVMDDMYQELQRACASFFTSRSKSSSVKILCFLETFWLESISAIFDIGTLEDDVPLGS